MLSSQNNAVMKGRFRNAAKAVQLGFLIVALSAILASYDSPSLALSVKIAASLSGAALLSSIGYLAKKIGEEFAIAAFLGIGVFTLFLLILAGGGMYSVSMAVLPLALIFSALFAAANSYIPLFISIFLGILFVGLNSINGWVVINDANGFGAWARLKDGVIIILVTGFATWAVGKGLNQAFSNFLIEKEEVIKAKSVIQALANNDMLTGLLNRDASKTAYEKAISELDRESENIAFYFIDLDHFKSINDLFDHSAGDALLATVANRLSSLGDDSTVVGRLGGDEFILFQVLSEDLSADKLAEEIRVAVSEPHNILGAPAQVTASIGITKVKTASFDQACKEADIAMYKVKHAKRNGYQFFSGEIQREYMTSVNVIHGLQDAVKKQLLEFHYQPKVDLKTGEILGVEALIRWTKDNPNQYGPAQFMPIVESTELVHEIGRWTIYEACRVCSEWHQQGHKISMAINVSPMQLAVPGFYKTVEDALKTTGLNPNYLEIELTEHLLIKEKQQFNFQLQRLKSLGVTLAIDDFGTGYSNLGYLTQLQVDILKLDRSFIVQMEHSQSTLAVIKAIIGMARVLKLKVIAEGIETQKEWKCLADMGCHMGQGYLWSKPVSSSALSKLLKKNNRSLSAEYDSLAILG